MAIKNMQRRLRGCGGYPRINSSLSHREEKKYKVVCAIPVAKGTLRVSLTPMVVTNTKIVLSNLGPKAGVGKEVVK